MKTLKRITSFFLAVIVMLSLTVTVFASDVSGEKAKAAIILMDETGNYDGEPFEVHFNNADTGRTVVAVTMTKQNSWGYGRGIVIELPMEFTYNIVFDGVENGYKIINTKDRSSVEQEYIVKDSNDFYWSIVTTENEVTTTDKDKVAVTNKEAEEVYRKFLEKVSFIETDESWYDGIAATLNQYGENSVNRNSYSQWYADYVQGGSKEEYFAMTSFEQFLWTETYTKLAWAINSSYGYSYFFADEQTFENHFTKLETKMLNGNNSEVVIEAYLELMDWQYNYITEHGVPFNFIRNRNYIEEMGSTTAPEETPVVTQKEEAPQNTTSKDNNVEPQVTQGANNENDNQEKDNDEKGGIWSDTMSILADNAITILILIVLIVAVVVIIRKRKLKNIDGDN